MRELDLAGEAETAGWRHYECEQLKSTIERLVQEIREGRVTLFASELERRMWFTDRSELVPAKPRRAG